MSEVAQLREEVKPDSELTQDEKAHQLPDPVGYKILCAIPDLEKTYAGSQILRPDSHDKREAQATVVLFVLKLGPGCYADPEKYPGGAWCKEGDFIITRMYAGTRFTVHGKNFCVVNDDQVECTCQDPRGIGRS